MNFEIALKMMKKGHKVKLPSWGGYWCWDDEKETIMMHCRPQDSDEGQGEVLDIRETQRVEYTLQNILSDDWIIADETNTPILGGVNTFGFDEAIKYLKRGFKLKRKNWNGKEQYIELATDIDYRTVDYELKSAVNDDIGSVAIAFNGTRGIQMGWLASQSDMLSTDWMFAE